MATSPRLKYPFVAGMGMTVYLVTANVTAAKIAAAASSRVLTISTSLVCGFAQKQKTPELGRPGGTQAPTPPTFASYGLTPFQVGRHWLSVAASICRLGTGLTVDPGISPGHGPRPESRWQNAERSPGCVLPSAFCFLARASRAVTADRALALTVASHQSLGASNGAPFISACTGYCLLATGYCCEPHPAP